jgi:hypothetical protein
MLTALLVDSSKMPKAAAKRGSGKVEKKKGKKGEQLSSGEEFEGDTNR